MANTLINFKRGEGFNTGYLTSLPPYSTNIVSAFSPNADPTLGPVMEPWVDVTHKQLWVNSQVINPKIVSISPRLGVSNVNWNNNTYGAYIELSFDDSGLTPPTITSNPLTTGTYTLSGSTPVDTDVADYDPLSLTTSELNAIYFGNGISYVVDPITKIGRVSCAFEDSFLDSVSLINDYTLHFVWNTGSSHPTTDVDLSSIIPMQSASYGSFITVNNPTDRTDINGNNTLVSAVVPGDSIKIEGQNTWIRIQGTQGQTQGTDGIEISHKLSGVIAGTYGDSTHVPRLTIDEAGHITGATLVSISGGQSTDYYGLGGSVEGTSLTSKGVVTLTKNGNVVNTIKLKHADIVSGVGSDVIFTDTSTSTYSEITMAISIIDGGTF